jgi:hypothetical protein
MYQYNYRSEHLPPKVRLVAATGVSNHHNEPTRDTRQLDDIFV